MAERRSGIVHDDRFLAHRNGGATAGWLPVEPFERPQRLEWTLRALEGSGLLARLQRIEARACTMGELGHVHTPAHLEALAEIAAGAARTQAVAVGEDTWLGPGSWDAALLAVGGLLEAVDAVVGGQVDNAYVLARPPGHHATADTSMGFCVVNAVAAAARHAQRRHGLRRVAIVDWDVHHGNGTEAMFLDDPEVLFVSLHQDGLYPADTGGVAVPGAASLNVPLPDGCGDDAYRLALERAVLPALHRHEPELILLSAGQDAAAADPLGRMALTTSGYRVMADLLLEASDSLCAGRLVAFQEGGYSLEHNAATTLAIIETLAGVAPAVADDPVLCDVPHAVSDAAHRAIEAAAAAQRADTRL